MQVPKWIAPCRVQLRRCRFAMIKGVTMLPFCKMQGTAFASALPHTVTSKLCVSFMCGIPTQLNVMFEHHQQVLRTISSSFIIRESHHFEQFHRANTFEPHSGCSQITHRMPFPELYTRAVSRQKTLSNIGQWCTATQSSLWWPSWGRCPTSASSSPTTSGR